MRDQSEKFEKAIDDAEMGNVVSTLREWGFGWTSDKYTRKKIENRDKKPYNMIRWLLVCKLWNTAEPYCCNFICECHELWNSDPPNWTSYWDLTLIKLYCKFIVNAVVWRKGCCLSAEPLQFALLICYNYVRQNDMSPENSTSGAL